MIPAEAVEATLIAHGIDPIDVLDVHVSGNEIHAEVKAPTINGRRSIFLQRSAA